MSAITIFFITIRLFPHFSMNFGRLQDMAVVFVSENIENLFTNEYAPKRLNILLTLHVHMNLCDGINISEVAKQFVLNRSNCIDAFGTDCDFESQT
jgi:hypothetical protein